MMLEDLPNIETNLNYISTIMRNNARQCAVCEKPAEGIHYGVYCCHGCKSFFRRAIIKKQKFPECSRGENCHEDESLGKDWKKCRSCRLQRCRAIGMKEMFTTTRKTVDNVDSVSKSCNIIRPLKNRNPYSIVKILVANLAHVDEKLRKMEISTYNPIILPNFREMIEVPSKLHLADKLGIMMGWPLSQSEYIQKHSELIDMKIRLESEELNYPIFTEFQNINVKDWFPFDLMMTVEYAKTFDFFHKLNIEDKLVLIRGSSIMIDGLTSTYYSYKSRKECIVKPDGVFIAGAHRHLVVNSLFASNMKFSETHNKWKDGQRILSFMIRDQLTQTEFLLLRAIILCNQALNLSSHAARMLQKEREKMSQALLNHCLMEHGKHGPIRFTTLINYITVLSDYLYDFTDFVRFTQIWFNGKTPQSRKRLLNEFFSLELR